MGKDVITGQQFNYETSNHDQTISLTHYNKDTLYRADSNILFVNLLSPSGAFVNIREAPPTENDECLSPTRFDQDLSYCSSTLAQKDILFKTFKIGTSEVLNIEEELFINSDPFFCSITTC